MLNLSPSRIPKQALVQRYSALFAVEAKTSGKLPKKIILALLLLLIIVLFLPWTQNIRSSGTVTTVLPGQRPQTVNSVIAGRIEDWFVREGDFVKKGDTIVFLSEIKDNYFDPDLIGRTQNQVQAKFDAVNAYDSKMQALQRQITALESTADFKLKQAQNKLLQAKLLVESDSMALEAATVDVEVTEAQFKRNETLFQQGLKSKTSLENRKQAFQKAKAMRISAENKWLASKNELINAEVEVLSIQAQYQESISKAYSSLFSTQSQKLNATGEANKLSNTLSNYKVRQGMYYITAPITGYITKAIRSGIGETIKEGEKIVSIMPQNYQLAVEMYVRPIDIPLINKEQHVRIQFDGWPAIVFSGWPNTSYGTYGGTVFAIDNFANEQGLYRILVAPDEEDHPWPKELRVGGGAISLALLQDVPVWYEIWRKINGFPPDFYTQTNNSEKSK